MEPDIWNFLLKRPPITRSMDIQTTISLMAEGNKNAQKLLELCCKIDPLLLLHLDDMNMRGVQILMAYGFCGGFFEDFRVRVVARDSELVNYVNKNCPGLTAVTRGGAPR